VSIEDSWCFVNCNWGARHVKCPSVADKEEMESGLFYQCDEFYFITDPEDHIYQHFPDDPKWQLLECPITLTEFINLPIVKSPFFRAPQLQLTKHHESSIDTAVHEFLNFGLSILIPGLYPAPFEYP
jgi:transglutaminase/protease-like cytokinesis protein 3